MGVGSESCSASDHQLATDGQAQTSLRFTRIPKKSSQLAAVTQSFCPFLCPTWHDLESPEYVQWEKFSAVSCNLLRRVG